MMGTVKRSRAVITIMIALLLIVATSLYGQEQKASERLKNTKWQGREPMKKELKEVLAKHQAWLTAYAPKGELTSDAARNDPRRADLSGVNLSGDRLFHVNLSGANLSKADLRKAHLSGADLSRADLRGDDLSGANLTGADLRKADLRKADLREADLSMAHLSGADLSRANLSRTKFEPRDLPNTSDIENALNFSEMTFYSSPTALFTLRESFKKSGSLQQEREITYAIRHTERLKLWKSDLTLRDEIQTRKGIAVLLRQWKVWEVLSRKIPRKIESIFKLVFFELTTKWGMVPGRALCIIGLFMVLFAFPYCVALQCPAEDGIWRVWDKDRVRQNLGGKDPERITVGWRKALLLGLYFSLLSAFRIGWRELNVGNWIARIQSREYTLQATGWVRTVSGIQSLLSMYLLAMWVLTYFGRPFE